MELLRNAMFLRSVQLILIILAGTACVILGYKLFLYGIDKGRSKLRSKSEIYKLIFSGSAPGLFFMVLGGLFLLFSIYSIGVASETGNLNKDLSGISEQLSNPLFTDVELPDTTSIMELISEASIIGIPTKPSSSLQTKKVKPKNKRRIKGALNATDIGTIGTKSVYRSEKELSRVINKHNMAIEYCYKKETKINPNLKGDLDVEFTIDYSGRVNMVRIVRSSMYNKNIEKCISNRIRGWRFKAISKHENDVKVKQKYIFG